MANRRVTLYLDADDYRELDELFRRMPGRETVSAFVRELMHQAIPGIRVMVEAAESGDRETISRLLDSAAGDLFARVGPEVAALRQALAAGPGEEVDP